MRLTSLLGGILGFGLFASSAQAGQSVTLAWDQNPEANVAGYRIHYGLESRTYTNMVDTGSATSVTIANLVEGATYYFAATAYNPLGLESDYSDEITYAVPTALAQLQTRVAPAGEIVLTLTGPIGYTYDILATQDFETWTTVGTVTVGSGGSTNFTDTNTADSSPRFYQTVPNSPARLQIRVAPPGHVVLTATGTIGQTYDILATQDLETWTTVGTVTIGSGGSTDFAETNPPDSSPRFYRTALRSLAELQIRVAPPGQVVLTVIGTVGHTYDIRATEDFKTWSVIGTVRVGAGGLVELTDTNPANSPQRFYRAHDLQP